MSLFQLSFILTFSCIIHYTSGKLSHCAHYCTQFVLISLSFSLIKESGSKSCPNGQFQCASSLQCIPMGWVCDSESDCGYAENLQPDTSDEDTRRCHKSNICPSNYFRCMNDFTCIKISQLCDGQPDCKDAYDEGDFCSKFNSVITLLFLLISH